MRGLAWSVFVFAILSGPLQAQTYDPRHPVCMKLITWGGGEWIDCSYASLPQCQASASGRAATCDLNPYFAQGPTQSDRSVRRHRVH